MPPKHDRIARLITARQGTCREGDVENRLAELNKLNEGLSGNVTKLDIGILATLANDTRYRIVRLLSKSETELCVCEIEPVLDVSSSAVSHALSDLYEAGLVDRQKDGKWRYYSITDCAEQILRAIDCTRQFRTE